MHRRDPSDVPGGMAICQFINSNNTRSERVTMGTNEIAITTNPRHPVDNLMDDLRQATHQEETAETNQEEALRPTRLPRRQTTREIENHQIAQQALVGVQDNMRQAASLGEQIPSLRISPETPPIPSRSRKCVNRSRIRGPGPPLNCIRTHSTEL